MLSKKICFGGAMHVRALVSGLLLGMLVACGGGGGAASSGSSGVVNASAQQMLDSFGAAVGLADGFSDGDSGADGTAGDGAPIANAQITVVDVAGKTVTVKTDAKGYYRVKLTGFTAPIVAYVVKSNGVKRYSMSVQTPVSGKFTTMNISSLTDKIASDIAIAGGKSKSADLTPALVKANASVIDTSIASMRVVLAGAILNAGLPAAAFDPLRTPFLANSTGYDNVLDNTVATVNSAGATQITQAAVLVAPALIAGVDKYVGTWVSNCLTNAGNTTQSGKYTIVFTKPSANTLGMVMSASVYSGTSCAGTATPSTTFATYTATVNYVDTVADGRDRFSAQNSTTVVKSALRISGTYLYAFNDIGAKDAQGYPTDIIGGGMYFTR